MKYKVGDKVRIKDDISQCRYCNKYSGMGKWQGKTMTVRMVCDDFYRMEEDSAECISLGWCWYEDMIDGYAEPTLKEFIESKIKQAVDEWNQNHEIVQLVHGMHKMDGKQYTWQNPDKVPVNIGEFVKVDAGGKELPVIVTGTVDKPLKIAKQYKKVLGTYDERV